MNTPSLKILLTHLEWNLQRLEEILKNEKTDYYRDAARQRFGHAFDMAVKCIEARAAAEAKPLSSAQQGFQWAAENQWLPADGLKAMCADHAALADKQGSASPDAVFAQLQKYLATFQQLHANLQALANQD